MLHGTLSNYKFKPNHHGLFTFYGFNILRLIVFNQYLYVHILWVAGTPLKSSRKQKIKRDRDRKTEGKKERGNTNKFG